MKRAEEIDQFAIVIRPNPDTPQINVDPNY